MPPFCRKNSNFAPIIGSMNMISPQLYDIILQRNEQRDEAMYYICMKCTNM